jgi:CRP-like cAMP-binding protein
MARPRVKLKVISSFVREHQRATAREVAHGVQVTVADASRWLHHLQRSGEIAVVDRVRVEHSARPVAVFAPVAAPMPVVCAHNWFG